LSLTGGLLNGKQFISKEQKKLRGDSRRLMKIHNELRDEDFERLFAKTAEKMNIQLEDTSEKTKEIKRLLEELKSCEDYLLKHLDDVEVKAGEEIKNKDNEPQLFANNEGIDPKNRISIDKLKDDYIPEKYNQSYSNPNNKLLTSELSNSDDNKAPGLELVSRISNSVKGDSKKIQRIEDITPMDFKEDLMNTTDWHLYYAKLSSLSFFVESKTYWPYFNQVFMISAMKNEGVDDLKRYLLSRAKPGPWTFVRSLVTDQLPHEVGLLTVRAKMLEYLSGEIPYELGLEVEYWEVDDDDCLNILINIIPQKSKYKYTRHLVMILF
jgi:hypothetical protein